MSTTVVKGSACVDWLIQATVLTVLQMIKNGTANKLAVRMMFHVHATPPILLKKLTDT